MRKDGRRVALTDLAIRAMKEPGRYSDHGTTGLYLLVSPTGAKSWLYRYMLDGRSREMGLGSVSEVPLATRFEVVRGDDGLPAFDVSGKELQREIRGARDLAKDARRLLKQGIDPIDARKGQRAAAQAMKANARTFRQVATQYIEKNRKAWRAKKHAQQWENTLEAFCYPVMGDVPVSEIDTQMVLRVLEPIWESKTETATRVRGRIEKILSWAATEGHRQRGENPAAWRYHLENRLPSPNKIKNVRHFRALDFRAAPAFLKDLRVTGERRNFSKLALEFILLTGVRTTEGIGARWSEFDLERCVWVIPAERMKMKREFRVPLSPAALSVLERAAALAKKEGRDSAFAFPSSSRRDDTPMSNGACLMVLKRMGYHNATTTHGLRSSFNDWASEATGFPNEVIEMSLAHTIRNKTEAAYRRGDLFDKRRKLMEAWGTYCLGPKKSATVENIGRARKKA